MTAAYVIEVDGEAVGLVVKEPEGFRFVAAQQQQFPIDGRVFRSAEQAERAATRLRQERGA